MTKPVVAIVGRPNVGKSTIFNRFAGERIAIVEDKPGITRDRIYSEGEWNGKTFYLIDTGGLDFAQVDEISERIRYQAELAIDEADVILFIVDGKEGLTEADKEVARLLHRANKPVVVGVNKVDHPEHRNVMYSFYEMGFADVFAISAAHGIGTGDLLDKIVDHFSDIEDVEYDQDTIRVAVIGRPNVGKSSLINKILGEERVLVSDVAGTTRDAIDTPFETDGQSYVLIDTAGMRKRGKVYETTEKYSVLRALKAIERCDVTLIVLDGVEGITEQDKRIAGLAQDAGRASIFVVNKWDAVEKDDKTQNRFRENIRSQFSFMDYAPILFVSAKTGQRVNRLFPVINEVAEQHAMRIATSVINQVLNEAIVSNPPASYKGRRPKILYGTQAAVKPPLFVLFVNDPELFHFSYLRYLENRFREAFGFVGIPIRIRLRQKRKR